MMMIDVLFSSIESMSHKYHSSGINLQITQYLANNFSED